MSSKQYDLGDIVSLCKRRGFIFQSSEIYGGMAACWDYGPLGVELKQNLKNLWWDNIVTRRENVVGMDGSILMHPEIWVASGHVTGFHDPLMDCKGCKRRFRQDYLYNVALKDGDDKVAVDVNYNASSATEALDFFVHDYRKRLLKLNVPTDVDKKEDFEEYVGWLMTECYLVVKADPECRICPECGGELTDPRNFNLMFKTHIGAVEDSSNIAYLRPETAQAIFAQYRNIQQSMRLRIPFGIAQMGKAFRNEVTTKSFIFRSIEFEQMEMQFFVHPSEDMKWFDYWLSERQNFYLQLGLRAEKLRLHEHGEEELAHYAKKAFDLEYEFPFGWQELEGVHHRSDFDLSQHADHSGKDLSYQDQETNEKYIPTVIETSAGVDRSILMFLCEAYEEQEEEGEDHKRETRVVLHFHPRIAPLTVAVFPLMRKTELCEVSEPIAERLRDAGFRCQHDVTGSIGKRYRRQDEIGTPFCLTVDYESLQDKAVTIRDRDSMEQVRLKIDALPDLIRAATKVKESNPRAGVDYQHLSTAT